MKKRILILYTSVGLGHKFIALNIAYHLDRDGYEVRLHDVYQLQSGVLVDLGKKLHGFVNEKLPFVWRWLYLSKWFTTLSLPLRVPLAGKNSFHVNQVIREFEPDGIIATQTSASAVIAYLKKNELYTGKFIIAFSDYHLHRYWLYDEADLYLANIEEQKEQMIKLGISSDKIKVCGTTLKPLEAINREAVKSKLGIKPNEKVVLLMSGSLGIGFTVDRIKHLAIELSKKIPDVRLIIVSGKNEKMQNELLVAKLPGAIVLGFYESMQELYAVGNVLLTKPGGLSMAEALQAGAKIIITHWLPGQEELNYHYLIHKGLVHPVPENESAEVLVNAIEKVLSSETTSETENSNTITQKNHEGKVLLKAVKEVFHGV